ncbi:MAG: hypothetical protein JXB05_00985 [Myxococcaceae bacterium]|nr:hypothetical protein [Myxococcaceae bacterium]
MALNPSALKTSLETDWLVPEGGTFPSSPEESAARFASAVASWFSSAQANLIPCTTAQVREPQLADALGPAFKAGTAEKAGDEVAKALESYIKDQVFGAGVANAPLGTAAAAQALSGIFSNLELANDARALQIAQACQTMALTTVVKFPSPTPPANVM